MMGTFASVLATKKIRTHTDRYQANAEGDIENVGGILKITEIRVRYKLKVSPEEEEDARWAMENYIEKCPAAMSVTGCIRLNHSLELIAG
ncbi:OsmC family protein [Malonomonas rubra]|uniref:OsmC family protein n=1 Tax=Malonomonas rubra TaxID=57040 RepID=UPI0026F0C672|nr:OsmC family protein [Malonomonas rubra]